VSPIITLGGKRKPFRRRWLLEAGLFEPTERNAMNRLSTAASALLLATVALAPLHAFATAPVESIVAAKPAQGVVSYPADYFSAAKPTNAFQMILRIPGFSFDSGAQVRGFAGAAGNVLIDGERPTSKQDDLGNALSRIQASQVVRIDVITGGAPGIDMQGRTQMANVILKRGGGTQGVAVIADKLSFQDGRNLPGMDLEFSHRDADRTFETAFNYGGFVDDGEGVGPHTDRDNTGALTYQSHLWTHSGGDQGILTGAYAGPLDGGKFRINGLFQFQPYSDKEVDTATLPAGDNDTFTDNNLQLKGELGVHYSHDLGAKATLETLAIQQVSNTHDRSVYDAPGDDELFTISNLNGESIVRSTLRYTASPTLTYEGALEGAFNSQQTKTRYLINGVTQDLPAADETVTETRGEAAFTATWNPSVKYTLEAGIRLEASQVSATGDIVEGKRLFYPKPRVVFTWSPDPKDQVRLRVEREVGQLDFGAFSASGALNAGGIHAGNPDALPQQAWVGEAVFERKFWDSADASITLRHSDITDAVDRIAGCATVGGGVCSKPLDCNDPNNACFDEGGNLPHGTENDLVADITLPLDGIGIKHAQLKSTATWRRAMVIDPISHMERPQSGVHPLDLEAHFTQDLASLSSTWGFDFAGGWRETDYRFDEVDRFTYGRRFNIFWEYKPTTKLTVRATAINFFSRGFQRQIDYYTLARNVVAPPDEIDWRNQQIGQLMNLSLRRTF
jgi:hypothetical protein